jgi:hypothetical protein
MKMIELFLMAPQNMSLGHFKWIRLSMKNNYQLDILVIQPHLEEKHEVIEKIQKV